MPARRSPGILQAVRRFDSRHANTEALPDELAGWDDSPLQAPRPCRQSDEQITDQLLEHLATVAELDLEGVDLQARHGVVVLSGSVPYRAMEYTIESIVSSHAGVVDVDNRLQVAPEPESAQ